MLGRRGPEVYIFVSQLRQPRFGRHVGFAQRSLAGDTPDDAIVNVDTGFIR